MTVYSPTGHNSINIPRDRGGCGVTHADVEDDRNVVDCHECEPVILKLGLGYGNSPAAAALTFDEQQEIDNEGRMRNGMVQAMAVALAQQGSTMLAEAAAAVPRPPAKKTAARRPTKA